MRKRTSKIKCSKIKSKKYKTRKSPPFRAITCANKIKKGKDGLYKSISDINGRYFWSKLSDKK